MRTCSLNVVYLNDWWDIINRNSHQEVRERCVSLTFFFKISSTNYVVNNIMKTWLHLCCCTVLKIFHQSRFSSISQIKKYITFPDKAVDDQKTHNNTTAIWLKYVRVLWKYKKNHSYSRMLGSRSLDSRHREKM